MILGFGVRTKMLSGWVIRVSGGGVGLKFRNHLPEPKYSNEKFMIIRNK